MRYRLETAIVLLGLGTWSLVNTRINRMPGQPAPEATPDSLLFSRTVMELRRSGSLPLAVDPTPLPPDPSIASIDPLVPGRMKPAGWRDAINSELRVQRMRELKRLRVNAESAWSADSCAKARFADLVARAPRRTRCLEGREIRVALIGIPRSGGPYLPGIVDERQAFNGSVFSVRVIELEVRSDVAVQSARDYVFRRDGSKWQLVKVRVLTVWG